MLKIDMNALRRSIIRKTKALRVGERYFMSVFHDVDGVWATVESASTAINSAGWPSTVRVKVEEQVGNVLTPMYDVGNTVTCNASNLYKTREDASPAKKYGKVGPHVPSGI